MVELSSADALLDFVSESASAPPRRETSGVTPAPRPDITPPSTKPPSDADTPARVDAAVTSARVDDIVEQVLQNYAEATAPAAARPAQAPQRPLTPARSAPPPPRAVPPPVTDRPAAAGPRPHAGTRSHAIAPARTAPPAQATPERPHAPVRLFPPRPQPETPPLPLQFADTLDPAHGRAEPKSATPPSNTRARILITLLILVLVLQSASIVWWLRAGQGPPVADTSSVTITSDPAGSVVSIDGAALGITPLTTTIAAGTHELRVGDEAPQSIRAEAGGSSTLHVVLATGTTAAAPTGSVEITTEPPGAAITVDGVSRGVSPVRVADLPPGTYAVTLARAGRLLRRSVTVRAGASTALVVAMERDATGSGWLTVTSPVPAQIYADGALIGRTDTPRTMLTPGRHQLLLVNEALNFREERTVEVGPGRTVALKLEAVNGAININAQPWASVWIDGTAVGETPIGNYSVPVGTHEVVLRHPELGERRETVTVGVGAPTRLGVDLRK